MKKLCKTKWLILVVLLFSLTALDVDAQRSRGRSGGRVITIDKFLVLDEGGYTNIRATPGGRVVSKVRDGSWIWLDENMAAGNSTWIKVYSSSGTFRGYIHRDKIEWLTWGMRMMVPPEASKRVRVNK